MTDAGFVETEWLVGMALLVLPVVLLVSVLPGIAARHEAVAAAAREGARAAAQSTTGSAARHAAAQAVAQVLTARGLPVDDAELVVDLPAPSPNGTLPREGEIAVTVRLPMPPITLPLLPSIPGPTAVGGHRRALDPFRSR